MRVSVAQVCLWGVVGHVAMVTVQPREMIPMHLRGVSIRIGVWLMCRGGAMVVVIDWCDLFCIRLCRCCTLYLILTRTR